MISDSDALETCKKIEGEMKRAYGGSSPIECRASRRSPSEVSYLVFVDKDTKKVLTFTHDFFERKNKDKSFYKWLKAQVEETRERARKGTTVIPDEHSIISPD